MRRIALLSAFAYVMVVGAATPALACSGGPPPWNDLLPMLIERTDAIVTGSYVRLDDVAVNGIFHVERYLYGSGPERLLIQSVGHPYIDNARTVHRRYTSCGGPRTQDLISDEGTYTYFLTRGRDGIYGVVEDWYFADPQATISVWDRDRGEVKLRAPAFNAQIGIAVGVLPSRHPDSDLPWPRTTPVLITTAAGRHYLLPVDTTELVTIPDEEAVDLRQDQTECSPPPCTAYSPNRLDIVRLQASGEEKTLSPGFTPVVENAVVGQRIAFSATSDTFALWRDGEIHIHALWNPALGYPDYQLNGMYRPSESLNAAPAGESLDYPVAWGPDGRTLAFSTAQGLWLWDALTSGQMPQLLIQATGMVPVVRYFSPRGRYLAVTEGSRHFTLDLVTGSELPDGVVSPDDRVLLAHDMVSDAPSSLEVIYLAPGPRQFTYYPDVEYRHVQWIDNEHFVASISGFSYTEWVPGEPYQDASGEWMREAYAQLVEEPFVEVATYHSSSIYSQHVVPMSLSEPQMRDFTYTPGPGLIEIAADGYRLTVHGYPVDLTSQLPDPIQSAVWLPYGFYFVVDGN